MVSTQVKPSVHSLESNMKIIVACACSFLFAANSFAGKFINLEYSVDSMHRTAALYLPDDYDRSKHWPLVIYLHGGGRGGDNNGEAIVWAKKTQIASVIARDSTKVPAFVLIPRCPKGKVWAPVSPDVLMSPWRTQRGAGEQIPDAADHITKAIDTVISQFSVDESKVSLTGFSMGGEGSIRYGALNVSRFAAIAPIAGSAIAIQADAPALASTNIWMFQGETDHISTAALGRKMSTWIKEAGGNIQYTEFKGIGHTIQKKAFETNDFIEWLISQESK